LCYKTKLSHPLFAPPPPPPLHDPQVPTDNLAAFEATSDIFRVWVETRLAAIRIDAGDSKRLVTVGHNSLHSLLPGNSPLDFVSHHS
jgi:hypothetical protein